MGIIPFNGLYRPMGKYKEILDYVLRPSPEVKPIDLCCGLGFSKTILGIQAACLAMDDDPRHVILFFEPDWDRIKYIFLPAWEKYVPEQLYTHSIGDRMMRWHNGAKLIYRPRVITGSKQQARNRNRGIETTAVIDDETADGFDRELIQNTFARIRLEANQRFFLTLTTPWVGEYKRFLFRGGNKIFRGRTRDNHYLLLKDPEYENRLRATMGIEQARRELDGELVAQEGRIWKTCKYSEFDPKDPGKDSWPNGNRNDIWTSFRHGEPWGIMSDFGSATGSYGVVQKMPPWYRGRQIYKSPKPVWVIVADLCPDSDADAAHAFERLKLEFADVQKDGSMDNPPRFITGGNDMNKTSDVDGNTIAILARNTFGQHVDILPCDEDFESKRLQLNRLDYLWCAAVGNPRERHLTLARDFMSLDTESHRGVREMIDEDVYLPKDKRRVGDVLPKNPEIDVQHIRDAVLMFAVLKGSRPSPRTGKEAAA